MLTLKAMVKNEQIGQSVCDKVFLGHGDILTVKTLEPSTHVYSFNRGMPPQVMEHMAGLLKASPSVTGFVCFDKPKVLEDYGFEDIELVREKVP